jgi:hypothetical protein
MIFLVRNIMRQYTTVTCPSQTPLFLLDPN